MGEMIKEDGESIDKTIAGTLEYTEGWWKGTFTDVIMNVAGFLCGWFVAKKLGFKFCINNINSRTRWCKKINESYTK